MFGPRPSTAGSHLLILSPVIAPGTCDEWQDLDLAQISTLLYASNNVVSHHQFIADKEDHRIKVTVADGGDQPGRGRGAGIV